MIYYLSQATLWGRDITTDQFGKYNLRIRKTLEAVYLHYRGNKECDDFKALTTYLKQVWFANGIHHHYGGEKFIPQFSEEFFKEAVNEIDKAHLPLDNSSSVSELLDTICPVIFNPSLHAKKVNKTDGIDIVKESAVNYYENVTQQEVEQYYASLNNPAHSQAPSYGLNSKLVKVDGQLTELVWKEGGLYGCTIKHITYWLDKARSVAENEQQRKVIDLLIEYYKTGNLELFDQYSIEWLKEQEGMVDFINGFIEVYSDPLGLKASWEGLVEYKDIEATKRTRLISDNAQWFEDHSPVHSQFKKKTVKGVTANVICAAMLGGDEYPSTAIGINLPNADWIRAQYGSKSVTIGNITDAYNKASHGNGFDEEFVVDSETLALIQQYGDKCDDLHTDLHECLGHGSGQLLPGVDSNALKSYGNVIEEARADLFGLYYIADDKLVELGLLPNKEAHKSQYYTYLMNGLLTQLVRINEGNDIEEAHMRNRALIARWVHKHSEGAVEIIKKNNKSFVIVNDYGKLRILFATLLAEIQRIKSEGDFEAARELVEEYAVKIEPQLHKEIRERYQKLNLAPYKGFVNPLLTPVFDNSNNIIDVKVEYNESYTQQMLRYSQTYSALQ